VFGTSKKSKQKGRLFNCFDIIKLDGNNQQDHVTAHFAEVIAAHLYQKHKTKQLSEIKSEPNKDRPALSIMLQTSVITYKLLEIRNMKWFTPSFETAIMSLASTDMPILAILEVRVHSVS
jgi:hypothetical protein